MKDSYYQQGDTLYFPCEIPKGEYNQIKTNVIQEGEATGHAHRLQSEDYEFFQHPKTKERYLRLVKSAIVTHEEHKPINLPPGEYKIGIVKEYDHFEEETRAVLD